MLRILLILGLLVTATIPVEVEGIAQGTAPSLLIWGFCPETPGGGEYIVLKNTASEEINGTWVLDDGEGMVKFSARIIATARVILFRGDGDTWERVNTTDVLISIDAIATRFRLSDSGDKIDLLTTDGELMDSVVYGTGDESSGWHGDPVPFIGIGFAPGRKDTADTDTLDDWDYLRRVNAISLQWDQAESVSVFAIPDAGFDALTNLISSAKNTLEVNSYTISGEPVYTLLARSVQRNVTVRLIVEGSPAGGRDNESLSFLSALSDSGVEVRYSGGLYHYNHAKYIIADRITALISTDNFGLTSFNPTGRCCNRGLGAIVRSPEIVSRLSDVFESDWKNATPYQPIVHGEMKRPVEGLYPPRFTGIRTSYSINVSLYITPETEASALAYLFNSAKKSIMVWISQVEIETSIKGQKWFNPFLTSLLSASRNGVDVCIIIEERYYPILNEWKDNNSKNIKIQTLRNGLTVHAKGAIIDGEITFISSLNWGFNSMYKNREIGIIIRDKNISSYLIRIFKNDWSGDIGDPIARISAPPHAHPGEVITLSGIPSIDDISIRSFLWKVDGICVSTSPEFTLWFDSPGYHTVMLTVTDSAGNSNSTSLIIQVTQYANDPSSVNSNQIIIYGGLTIIVVVIIIQLFPPNRGRTAGGVFILQLFFSSEPREGAPPPPPV